MPFGKVIAVVILRRDLKKQKKNKNTNHRNKINNPIKT